MDTPNLKTLLLVTVCIFFLAFASAQTRFSISGTVTGEKGEPIKLATVFLSGTQRITGTDDKGHFIFNAMEPGAYQVTIKMLGYGAVTQNVMIQKTDADLKIKLAVQPIELREVIVGGDKNWAIKFALFKVNFLGPSDNGQNCKILNPDILNLKVNKLNNTLDATSDDFMIIENKQLGYKIKYLLKDFVYHYDSRITNYNGDASFEDLPGTDKMKLKWKENRQKAYYGSLMQFFRSVYKGKDQPLKDGFLTRGVVTENKIKITDASKTRVKLMSVVDERLVAFDSLVSVVDTSFVSLKFKQGLAVVYDPKKAARPSNKFVVSSAKTETVFFNNYTSTLQLTTNDAVIDSRGNYTNYHAFLIKGYWGIMRIGDQLPFEYQP